MEFKGSRTEKNVLAAFAGESQARTRYSFFASAARKEGFEQIGAVFQQTSDEEKEHAKLFFKQLKGGDSEITAAYPAGVIGTTRDNLMAAAKGEKMEWGTLYPAFAKMAEDEGFKDIGILLFSCKDLCAVFQDTCVLSGLNSKSPFNLTRKPFQVRA
jgi:rubrerythrin